MMLLCHVTFSILGNRISAWRFSIAFSLCSEPFFHCVVCRCRWICFMTSASILGKGKKKSSFYITCGRASADIYKNEYGSTVYWIHSSKYCIACDRSQTSVPDTFDVNNTVNTVLYVYKLCNLFILYVFIQHRISFILGRLLCISQKQQKNTIRPREVYIRWGL